jgi:hypothetical protein
MNPPGFVQ